MTKRKLPKNGQKYYTHWPFFENFFAPVNLYSWPLANSFLRWNPIILNSLIIEKKLLNWTGPRTRSGFSEIFFWNNQRNQRLTKCKMVISTIFFFTNLRPPLWSYDSQRKLLMSDFWPIFFHSSLSISWEVSKIVWKVTVGPKLGPPHPVPI